MCESPAYKSPAQRWLPQERNPCALPSPLTSVKNLIFVYFLFHGFLEWYKMHYISLNCWYVDNAHFLVQLEHKGKPYDNSYDKYLCHKTAHKKPEWMTFYISCIRQASLIMCYMNNRSYIARRNWSISTQRGSFLINDCVVLVGNI